MVARRILVPPVRVRILPRQRKERAKSLRFSSFFFFTLRANVKNCIFRGQVFGGFGNKVIKSYVVCGYCFTGCMKGG